jgi:hypothetical protein
MDENVPPPGITLEQLAESIHNLSVTVDRINRRFGGIDAAMHSRFDRVDASTSKILEEVRQISFPLQGTGWLARRVIDIDSGDHAVLSTRKHKRGV